jgi:hypothetical protein
MFSILICLVQNYIAVKFAAIFKVLVNWVGVLSWQERPTPEDVIVKQKSVIGVAPNVSPPAFLVEHGLIFLV